MVPRPVAIGDSNVSRRKPGLGRVNHMTVSAIFLMKRERLWGAASLLSSRLFPPAPLTGDVGRGCGDASRALLFFALSHRGGPYPSFPNNDAEPTRLRV